MSEQLMTNYYATYNSEDPVALRAFYHDDVLLVSAQGETVGVDAIIATYQYLIDLFFDKMTPQSITLSQVTSGADFIAEVEIVDRFTAKKSVDDFMGQTLEQGDSFELKLRGRYQVESGRIKTIHIEMK